jgi:hypothetical protein
VPELRKFGWLGPTGFQAGDGIIVRKQHKKSLSPKIKFQTISPSFAPEARSDRRANKLTTNR